MGEAFIIDACRTPRGIGKQGRGALAHMHPQHLSATVLKAIRDRNDLDTAEVDDVIWSTSNQSGQQGHDIGRMAALDAGYDIRASGVTISRFCGGGISSINMAAASIMAGVEDLIVAGGMEMMSYVATQRSDGPRMMDVGNLRLRAAHPQSSQGVCADAIAALEGITRADTDALALLSQQNADRAISEGRFARSLVPVLNEDGSLALDHEEFPRPQTTAEGLATLKPSFGEMADVDVDGNGTTYRTLIQQKYPGLDIVPIHHAGNSSGVVDGSAALLLASPAYAKRKGMAPRAPAPCGLPAPGH
jgi:acetyl-CoA C-acetyltransferase